MNKLPVWNTAWRGIIFPVTHFVPLLRRLALPIALLAGCVFLQMAVLPMMLMNGTLSIEALTVISIVMIPVFILAYLNLFMGSLQVAIGTPEAKKIFGLGKVEGLFIGYLLLVVCSYFISYIPFLLLTIAGVAVTGDTGFIVVLMVLFVFVFVFFWMWALVRLLPVLGMIADQKRLGLAQAWRMSKGNWWQILGASCVLGLFYFLIFAPFAALWLQNLLPQFLEVSQSALPPGRKLLLLSGMMASSGWFGLFYAAWFAVLMIAQYGLAGFIYTALKGQGDAPDPVAEAAPATA